ncbi:MAG: Bifunctional NAD(P)H-hydrate repair enzyme Nnr [Rhodocyclaceae bacterium]|nr:NAD(P)H-hydrate dehydratase [Zoogloeaceae bacterium]MBV6407339.1 Bifunctional NAD(P)H-hydrate repair enzyme Nnr [Rhodocyclaceae bacterium]MCK6383822.1 NAD(P)H-hydrate dehydratase [Rhodocyclaceae bacterium]
MEYAPSRPICDVAALRAIESRHADADPPLMERAGAGAVPQALTFLAPGGAPPLVVCGPGNNGGDGFVLARLLRERGIDPVVVFAGDEARLPADARKAHDRYRAQGGTILDEIPRHDHSLAVDALFGIGLQRPLAGAHAALVERINGLGCPVLALDIPSGLCADTGRVLGRAVRADATLTFIALKPGLLTLDGPDHCGAVSVDGLGLAAEGALPSRGRTVTPALFAARLAPRPRNSHKGMMGSVGILGGAPGMAGAALLAGRAALKLGAGRVHVGQLDDTAPALDAAQPELMLRKPGEILAAGLATALAAGPGLGQSAAALDLLKGAVAAPLPLVLDADALNLLASHPVLAAKVSRRRTATLLTPHPLEAARLLGCDAAAVQADRVQAALKLAEKFNATAVLKGCGSVIAAPDGRWFINGSGNPGMASAGMGDVLAGLAATLLAQGWEAESAALCAVHLHGLAADLLVGGGIGPAGLTANETIDAARRIFNAWIQR